MSGIPFWIAISRSEPEHERRYEPNHRKAHTPDERSRRESYDQRPEPEAAEACDARPEPDRRHRDGEADRGCLGGKVDAAMPGLRIKDAEGPISEVTERAKHA